MNNILLRTNDPESDGDTIYEDLEIHFVKSYYKYQNNIKIIDSGQEIFPGDVGFPEDLLKKYQYWTNADASDFSRLPVFIENNPDIPLLFMQGDTTYHLTWTASIEQDTTINVAIENSRISFNQQTKKKNAKLLIIIDDYQIDIDNLLIAPAGYSSTDLLFQRLFSSNRHYFDMEVDTYKNKALTFKADVSIELLNEFRFRSDSIVYKPKIIQAQYQVILNLDIENRSAKIEPMCMASSDEIPLFSLITNMQTHISNAPQPIRTKKRQKAIQDGLYQLICSDTIKSKNKVLKETLYNLDNRKKKPRGYVKQVLADFSDNICQNYIQFRVMNNQIEILLLDYSQYLLSYLIPLRLFGANIFDSPKSVELSLKQFLPKLQELSSLYIENNIDFLFKNKRVEKQSLDVSIDASKEGASKTEVVDWFSLSTDVMCHNRRISDDDWKSIVSNGGIYTQGEEIMFIDDQSIDKLRALIDICPKKKSDNIIKIPRLQIFDWLSLKKLGINVKLSDRDNQLIESLSNLEALKKKPLPKHFIGKLRKYQEDGVAWLGFLYEHRFGACLADDMGLGKTVQAIVFIGQLKEHLLDVPYKNKTTTHLIVVPPSLIFNWHHEFEKFYPNVTVIEYIGANRAFPSKLPDIILTTYDIVRRDIEMLKEITFDVIIFDEAQFIKNIVAKRTAAIRQLKANFKLGLTGTPVENHLGEYFSIMDLALPGIFGKYQNFMRDNRKSNIRHYLKRSVPFMLRRTKDKILKDLPPKMESDVYLHLTDHQKSLYTRMVAEVRGQVAEAFEYKTVSQAGIVALTALLRLRQICISPSLVDRTDDAPSPKIDYLMTKLIELGEEGHAALIFSQFTRTLDIIEDQLTKANINYIRMDGKTPTAKRKNIVASFQKKDGPPFFLISLKTGGVGLNLTRASYVFHVDPWWNPAVENQATDRTHRIGQKKKVQVFRLLMHDTVEEKMMVLKNKKAQLYETIMLGTKKSGTSLLSKDEFNYLLTS